MKGRICVISAVNYRNVPYGEILLPPLAKEGWDITLYAPEADDSLLRRINPYQLKTHNLKSGKDLKSQIQVLKAMLNARLDKFDLVLIQGQSLSSRAPFIFCGPRSKQKLIYHNLDYYCPFEHPFYWHMERSLVRKSDLYINNEFHRGYFTRTAYRAKTSTITLPPNLPSYWPIPKSDPNLLENKGFDRRMDDFVIILHGGYSPLRRVDEIFKALTLLPESYKLLMTGGSPEPDSVDRIIENYRLTSRVIRLPRLDFQELLTYTVNADAGILLYANNDFGNFFTAPGRMCEYLASGLPLLGADHTGLELLIRRYNLGQCVDGADPRSIAKGLENLRNGIEEGRYPRQSIREKFIKHFAFENWESVLTESIGSIVEGVSTKDYGPVHPWMPSP